MNLAIKISQGWRGYWLSDGNNGRAPSHKHAQEPSNPPRQSTRLSDRVGAWLRLPPWDNVLCLRCMIATNYIAMKVHLTRARCQFDSYILAWTEFVVHLRHCHITSNINPVCQWYRGVRATACRCRDVRNPFNAPNESVCPGS